MIERNRGNFASVFFASVAFGFWMRSPFAGAFAWFLLMALGRKDES